MADLYRLLVDVERALQSWTRPLQEAGEPSMEDNQRQTVEAANAFQDFFLVNRIWFSTELVESIQRFNATTRQTFLDYQDIPEDGVSSESTRTWKRGPMSARLRICPVCARRSKKPSRASHAR